MKMQSILDEIYYYLSEDSQINSKKSEKEQEFYDKKVKLEEEFTSTLLEEQIKSFEELMMVVADWNGKLLLKNFKFGYKIGTQIMIETFHGSDSTSE